MEQLVMLLMVGAVTSAAPAECDWNTQTMGELKHVSVRCRVDVIDSAFAVTVHGELSLASVMSLAIYCSNANNASFVSSRTLRDLSSLVSLRLEQCRTVLDEGTFTNVTRLKELVMKNSRLKYVPRALIQLQGLERLDLSDNDISSIDGDVFSGMFRLQSLSVEGNRLTSVTSSMLQRLTLLKILNLSNNLVSSVQVGAFNANTQLEAVRLDDNQLAGMSDLFVRLPRLRWLNVSDNHIVAFDYNMLPLGLQWLDLHSNRIRQLEDADDIANHMSIVRMDASFNRLTSLNGRILPRSSQLLLLNDNKVSHVEQYTFFMMSNLTRVDLFANQITHLELNAFRLNLANASANAPEFHIGGNPFVCDCTMEWLQRYDQMDSYGNYPRVMDLESIYCRLTYHREHSFVPLMEADTSMFLCPYQRHCFTTCHCCDFDACDCEMTCPDKCRCYHDQSWSSNVVDCSSNDFSDMPERLPMDTTEVYLDGNILHNLSSLTFLGRKNMRVLFLNYSEIEYLANETFVGLVRLTELHLEDNNIHELVGRELAGLDRLKQLHLQRNKLHSIASDTFNHLLQLEQLRLDSNHLVTFPVWQLQDNHYLVAVNLAGNQWSCQCDFLYKMRTWLMQNVRRIVDVEKLVCELDDHSQELAIIKSDNVTCYKKSQHIPQSDTMSTTEYVVIVLSTLSVIALIVCLLVVFSVYRTELRLMIFSRFGVRVCHQPSPPDEDHERFFDAFVSHSDNDRTFVQQVLVAKLEHSEPPYRLALHDRDFAHSTYLADTIVEAVRASRRTIMVISKSFVENEWCRFQFKSAHHEVLKDRQKRLIVVMLGDVTVRDLDPDLRLCLKINTCIKWQDRLFWEKLRFAMPDVKDRTHVANSVSHYSEIDESRCYGRSPDTEQSLYE